MPCCQNCHVCMPFQPGYRSFLLVSKQLGCTLPTWIYWKEYRMPLNTTWFGRNKIGDHCAYFTVCLLLKTREYLLSIPCIFLLSLSPPISLLHCMNHWTPEGSSNAKSLLYVPSSWQACTTMICVLGARKSCSRLDSEPRTNQIIWILKTDFTGALQNIVYYVTPSLLWVIALCKPVYKKYVFWVNSKCWFIML